MLYDIFKPVFFCSYICGMTPFSIRGTEFKVSKLSLIWNGILVVTCCVLPAIAFSSRTFERNKLLIYNITDFMQAWLSVINVIAIIVLGCVFRRKTLLLIKQLCAVDREFQKLNFAENREESYKIMRMKAVAATVFTSLFVVYVNVFDGLTYGKPYLNPVVVGDFLTYWMPTICSSYLILQFCTFVAVLKERFGWLNKQLRKIAFLCSKHNLIKTNSNTFISTIPADVFNENIASTLKTIQMKHKALCTLCSSLNTIYSVQLLTTICEIFFTYLSTIFFWLHKELLDEWNTKIMKSQTYFFYSSGLLLLHATQVIAVILFCSKTAREANRSGTLLHDIQSSSWCVESQIFNFSGQLLHCKVEFTACKIFAVDETLLYAMISATTTYLVIVLQFEIAIGANSDY